MNKYVEALNRLSNIDLDYVLDELGYEGAEKVSFYGMNDYPNLEKQGDIDLLQELVDKETPLKPSYKQINNNLRPYCGKCGLRLKKTWSACPRCENRIDWRKDY